MAFSNDRDNRVINTKLEWDVEINNMGDDLAKTGLDVFRVLCLVKIFEDPTRFL